MQCFAMFVNFIFASGQFPEHHCQRNYLISLSISVSPKREANYSKTVARCASVFLRCGALYAQDLQISSRGFGSLSAFAVRGVRLITAGIPATMPDGQGLAAMFDLDMADRIEVLRGPFSALYDNHSEGRAPDLAAGISAQYRFR
jgi:hypothetical protein